MVSPKNKKVTISAPANKPVFPGCRMTPLLFILIMAGTVPNTSIMANKVRLIVTISENCKENIKVNFENAEKITTLTGECYHQD
jgi:hypothetical protein